MLVPPADRSPLSVLLGRLRNSMARWFYLCETNPRRMCLRTGGRDAQMRSRIFSLKPDHSNHYKLTSMIILLYHGSLLLCSMHGLYIMHHVLHWPLHCCESIFSIDQCKEKCVRNTALLGRRYFLKENPSMINETAREVHELHCTVVATA